MTAAAAWSTASCRKAYPAAEAATASKLLRASLVRRIRGIDQTKASSDEGDGSIGCARSTWQQIRRRAEGEGVSSNHKLFGKTLFLQLVHGGSRAAKGWHLIVQSSATRSVFRSFQFFRSASWAYGLRHFAPEGFAFSRYTCADRHEKLDLRVLRLIAWYPVYTDYRSLRSCFTHGPAPIRF